MYNRLEHRADIYIPTSVVSAAGQRKTTWALETSAIHCIFLSRFASTRVAPTYENADSAYLIIPASIVLNYGKRIYNITDRAGNVIEPGPFQIDTIAPIAGFSGKIRHHKVSISTLKEQD